MELNNDVLFVIFSYSDLELVRCLNKKYNIAFLEPVFIGDDCMEIVRSSRYGNIKIYHYYPKKFKNIKIEKYEYWKDYFFAKKWFVESEVTIKFISDNQYIIEEVKCSPYWIIKQNIELPNNIEKLTYNCQMDPTLIKELAIPLNIKYLCCENVELENELQLPDGLEELVLKPYKKYSVNLRNLRCSLKKLKLIGDCAVKQDFYYYNLTHLYLDVNNDSPVISLPESLLYFCYFSKPSLQLPNNLKKLHLSEDYNYLFAKLPDSLEKLSKYNHEIPLSKLNYFKSGSCFNKPLNNISQTLKYLYLGSSYSLNLDLSNFNLHLLSVSSNIQIVNYGKTLVKLCVGGDFNNKLIGLPDSLKILEICDNYDQELGRLPEGLTTLKLGDKFNQSINNIPDNIEILEFSTYSKFDHDIYKLPEKIITMIGPKNYTKKIILKKLYTNFVFITIGPFTWFKYEYPVKINYLSNIS